MRLNGLIRNGEENMKKVKFRIHDLNSEKKFYILLML